MRLFKRKGDEQDADERSETRPAGDEACAHVVLTPRWDSVGDIGDETKATSFTCEACKSEFTPEQARALRASEARRVQERVG